jgi:hypothetical protein
VLTHGGLASGAGVPADAILGVVCREGQEVVLNEERPNGELLLARGELLDSSPKDCLFLDAALIPADRYYQMKESILEALGFAANFSFPIFADRMPVQLLAYVRLARVEDPALFAKVHPRTCTPCFPMALSAC